MALRCTLPKPILCNNPYFLVSTDRYGLRQRRLYSRKQHFLRWKVLRENSEVTIANPLRIVLRLMDTYYQWVPQPNGVFESSSKRRLLLVGKLSYLVVIEPCHNSTITAQGEWVMAST